MLPPQTDNVITPPLRLCQFAEVSASSLSLASVCMAVTLAALNGEINYHRCHLWRHRSQFDHVNQMIGPLDVGALCNHALMEGIKMHLGHLTVFIIRDCHWVTWTIKWLTRSHCPSLTLTKKSNGIEMSHVEYRRAAIQKSSFNWSPSGNNWYVKNEEIEVSAFRPKRLWGFTKEFVAMRRFTAESVFIDFDL